MDMVAIASHAATATAHYQEIYRQRFLALVAGWDGEGTTEYVEKALNQAQRLAEVNTEETYKGKLPEGLILKAKDNIITIHTGLPYDGNAVLRVQVNGQCPTVPTYVEAEEKERRLVNPELED